MEHRYLVGLDGSPEKLISLTRLGPGRYRARLQDGREVELESRGHDEEGRLIVLIDGTEHRLVADASTGDGQVSLAPGGPGQQPRRARVEPAARVLTGQRGPGRRGAAQQEGQEQEVVTSPITGVVLSIAAQAGDRVGSEEELLVIEAMKMENSLPSPREAVVESIECQVGQTVMAGDVLVRLRAVRDSDG